MIPFSNKWVVMLRAPFMVSLCLLLFACSGDQVVSISWDTLLRDGQAYELSVVVKGNVGMEESERAFSGTLDGKLLIERTGNSKQVSFGITQPELETNYLDTPALRHSQMLLEKQSVVFRIENGDLLLPDAMGEYLPMPSQWDIVRNLSRVVPSFPQSPSRVGTVWDRQRTIPLATRSGDVLGHLFQSFSLDSVTETEQESVAWVSWKYTYKVESLKEDSLVVLDKLPQGGKGTVVARVNLERNILEFARSDFQTVHKDPQGVEMALNESVVLQLAEDLN